MKQALTLAKAYTFHTDPGHGWLAVATSEIEALNIPVTPFSYVSPDGLTYYLEEDLDAGTFLALRKKLAIPFEIVETHTNASHWIRNLTSGGRNKK